MINNRATMIASELAGEGGEGFWTIASADGRRQLELAQPACLPDIPSICSVGSANLGLNESEKSRGESFH